MHYTDATLIGWDNGKFVDAYKITQPSILSVPVSAIPLNLSLSRETLIQNELNLLKRSTTTRDHDLQMKICYTLLIINYYHTIKNRNRSFSIPFQIQKYFLITEIKLPSNKSCTRSAPATRSRFA